MNFFRKLLLYSICLVMVLPAGLAEAMALTPSLNIYSETYVVMDANTGPCAYIDKGQRQERKYLKSNCVTPYFNAHVT